MAYQLVAELVVEMAAMMVEMGSQSADYLVGGLVDVKV
jgi:hypothetical protein